jgi:hypothetical protein
MAAAQDARDHRLPALELENGETLKESMVIMRYFDDRFPDIRIARADPYEHAVEQMLCATDGAFTGAGYRMILNRDPAQRDALKAEVDAQYARLDAFLRDYAPDGDFLFDRFGWAEVAFAPMFKRLWFLEYYEDYAVPAASHPRLALARGLPCPSGGGRDPHPPRTDDALLRLCPRQRQWPHPARPQNLQLHPRSAMGHPPHAPATNGATPPAMPSLA